MMPGIALLAAIAVVAALAWPTLSLRRDDKQDRGVFVTVEFTPATRSGKARAGGTLLDRVTIQLIVAGSAQPKQFATKSPWTALLHPRKGETVVVSAEQFFGDLLACSITQSGGNPAFDSKHGPAIVTCKRITM